MLFDRSEPMDDGDGRVGQIVRIEDHPAARPRLAWQPWLRGFACGAPFWITVGALAAALWFGAQIRGLSDAMNRISHYEHKETDDGSVQGDQAEHR